MRPASHPRALLAADSRGYVMSFSHANTRFASTIALCVACTIGAAGCGSDHGPMRNGRDEPRLSKLDRPEISGTAQRVNYPTLDQIIAASKDILGEMAMQQP